MLKKIGIIGAGFSGTMVAYNLVMLSKIPLDIRLFDVPGKFQKGIAYSNECEEHVLNVPAENMSAIYNDPTHFIHWLQKQEHYPQEHKLEGAFVPRKYYGEYLNQIWIRTCVIAKCKKINLESVNGEILKVRDHLDGYTLHASDGTIHFVDEIVLATGNALPQAPGYVDDAVLTSEMYIPNPWESHILKSDQISGDKILILGNGLTMADTVLELVECGYKGKIYSISPRGFQLSSYDKAYPINKPDLNRLLHSVNLNTQVRLFTEICKKAEKGGFDPYQVAYSMRLHIIDIWKKWTITERKEFIHNYASCWNSLRHRLAPQVFHKLSDLKQSGQWEVIKAEILKIRIAENKIILEFLNKGNAYGEMEVTALINCTGSQRNPEMMQNPLIFDMLQTGKMVTHNSGIGIRVEIPGYYVYDQEGNIQTKVRVLGPLLMGELWESTAVRELRQQAFEIAGDILGKQI